MSPLTATAISMPSVGATTVSEARRVPDWSGRRRGLAWVALAAAGIGLAGCGSKLDTPLPDVAEARGNTADSRRPLTPAEQKQAIDALSARRDGKQGGSN